MPLNKKNACFIIAEIGLNHNGDYQMACDSIFAAAEAGVCAVKFQNFITEDFLLDKKVLLTYKSGSRQIKEPLFDVCKRSEMQREWIPKLKKLCDEVGVMFISTPTSEQGVDDLIENGTKIIKNGSDYLTHIPLIKYMATSGASLILSTGMAYQVDIDVAVKAARQCMHADSELILLHCTSTYPTLPEDVNLRKIQTLRERYNVTVGFSDHTEGWVSAVQAVTLGARVVEKHFTLDRSLPGPDHWFSSNPSELRVLVSQIREAEKRLGVAELIPARSEMEVRDQWRLGLVWGRNMIPGEVVKERDISIKKPALGLLPKDIDKVIGGVVTAHCNRGDAITNDHFS